MSAARPLRLGILATHPIQYFAPLFRTLAADARVEPVVHFAHRPTPQEQGVGFGVAFEWDVDLTSGYEHRFLKNVSSAPSLATFAGCDTPEIGGIVRDGRFDAFLVLGWNTKSYWQAMLPAWRADLPVLVRGDSQLAPAPPLKAAAKRVLYPRFMRRFAACLATGIRSAEYFRHYGARRVVSSPHFVDNDAFARRADAARARREALRAAFGAGPSDTLVLFAGKFVAKKRPADVLRAVAALRRGDVKLLFVGDGELRDAVQREAVERGVAAHFAGFLNQTRIAEAYAASDVLVLPSDHGETWGLVANEAMASGVGIVVSEAAGCAPDLVVNGETGFAFPLGDVESLAERLSRVARPGAAARLGEHARRHVARYSAAAAAEGIVRASLDAARRS